MSDVMMFGIAKMPYEMAMGDEMSRRQFYANTQRLADALEAAREDAERYRFIAADKSPAWDEELDAAIDAAREARND